MKKCSTFISLNLGMLSVLIFAVSASASEYHDISSTPAPETALRVGSEVEFPPFAMVDENGNPVGFSVDLIKAVAAAMGISITFTTGPWDTMWNGLVSGSLDVLPIVAISPERHHIIDFSLPHTETFDAFFVPVGKKAIPRIEDAMGKEIVVMRSDAAHHALESRNFRGKLILAETIPEGLSLVASGRHDAFLCSKLIGTLAMEKHHIKGLMAGPIIADYKRVFAFGVHRGADELREKLNQGLMIIKSNGEYRNIYEKWLTVSDPWAKYQKAVLMALPIVVAIVLAALTWSLLLRRAVQRRTLELAAKNTELEKEIVARREAEEALHKSEERFDLAVKAAQEGVWDWNVETDEVWYSSRYKEMLGYSEDEIEHHISAWLRLLHPDDKDRCLEIVDAVMRGERDYEMEFRLEHKDGHYLDILSRGLPVRRESDGKIFRIVGIHFDLSTHKRIQDELQRIMREQQIILDNANIAISLVQNRKQVWINHKTEEMFQYSAEDMVNHTTRKLYPSQEAYDRMGANAYPVLASGMAYETVQELVRRDGSHIWVKYNGKAIDPPDMSAGTLWLLEDITAHREMEEALRRSHEELEQRVAERTQELSQVNEELRQVITELKKVETTLQHSLEEKTALLKEIHHRVKNNLQIVSSLLWLQMNRSTNQQVIDTLKDTRNRVSAMALLHERLYHSANLASINFSIYLKDLCKQLMNASAPKTGHIEILQRVAPIGLPLEKAVPCALIVSELVSNALKHGFPDNCTGAVWIEMDVTQKQNIVLSVRDNGVGLPSNFDLLDTSSLGLQIVTKLIDQLDGRFEIGTSGVKGAFFSVTFPLQDSIGTGDKS